MESLQELSAASLEEVLGASLLGAKNALEELATAKEGFAAARKDYLECMEQFMTLRRQETLLDNLAREEPLSTATFDPPVPAGTKEQLALEQDALKEKCKELSMAVAEILRSGEETQLSADAVNFKRKAVVARCLSLKKRRASFGDVDHPMEESIKTSVAEADTLEQDAAREEASLEEIVRSREDVEAAIREDQETLAAILKENEEEVASLQSKEAINTLDDEAIAAKRDDLMENIKRSREARDWFRSVLSSVEAVGGFSAHCESEEGDPVYQLVLRYTEVGGHAIARIHLGSLDHDFRRLEVELPKLAPRSKALIVENLTHEAKACETGIEGARKVAQGLPILLSAVSKQEEHVKELHKSYLVSYRPEHGEVTISLAAGVTLDLRVTNLYGHSPGGVHLRNLAGVGGWSNAEMEQACAGVNTMGLFTLLEVVQEVRKRLESMDRRRRL
jgi:hypothetical protein